MNEPLSNNFHSKKTRNKAETIQLIIDSAEQIIINEGIYALKINKLERNSGKSKKLIYDYFGSINGVLLHVLKIKDSWGNYKNELNSLIESNRSTYGELISSPILKNHFINQKNNKLSQLVNLLELSLQNEPSIKELSQSREVLAHKLFSITDPLFKDKDIDIRCIYALLIAGINYLVLHKNATGTTFCEIDIDRDEENILTSLDKLLSWTYDAAKK